MRVGKDDGYTIILEQYNECNLCASILFYLTLIFSMLGTSMSSFGWGKDVIVSFLTSDEIRMLLDDKDNGTVALVENDLCKIEARLRYKITLLLSNIGRILIIGRIHKHV